MSFDMLDSTVKDWLIVIGYCGGCLVISAALYKWFATMVGKAIVKELVKAGIIAVITA